MIGPGKGADHLTGLDDRPGKGAVHPAKQKQQQWIGPETGLNRPETAYIGPNGFRSLFNLRFFAL